MLLMEISCVTITIFLVKLVSYMIYYYCLIFYGLYALKADFAFDYASHLAYSLKECFSLFSLYRHQWSPQELANAVVA